MCIFILNFPNTFTHALPIHFSGREMTDTVQFITESLTQLLVKLYFVRTYRLLDNYRVFDSVNL